MSLITIIFISIGLAMDALAVSIASGVIIKRNKYAHALRFGLSFGVFQMLMPILGWFIGLKFQAQIESIDHWLAFFLLVFIGVKMIYEAMQMESAERVTDAVSLYLLLALSVATSIDALAVGLSFAFLGVSVIIPSLIIGLVTFVLSYSGFLFGRKCGPLFENKVEILGGLILIGIGFKILIQHLIFS